MKWVFALLEEILYRLSLMIKLEAVSGLGQTTDIVNNHITVMLTAFFDRDLFLLNLDQYSLKLMF